MNNRDALLVEYQVCQQSQNSTTQSYWTLSGIFIGITSVVLGGLIYGVLSNSELLKLLLGDKSSLGENAILMLGLISFVVSMAVLIILYFLWGWLKRVNFLTYLNYKRMREIEFKLKMRKSLIVQAIDDWDKLKPELEKLSKEDKDSITKYLKEFYQTHKEQIERDYELPSGIWHHKWIFGTLFFIWGLLLAASIYLLFRSGCYIAFDIALGVVALIAIGVFLGGKCLKRKYLKRSKKLETI